MKEFLFFLKSGKTGTEKKYFQDFIILFSIVFLIKVSISVLKNYINNTNMIVDDDLKMLNWEAFIGFALVIPIFEEAAFRAPLLIPKAKIYSIIAFIAFIIGIPIYIRNQNLTISITIILISVQVLYLVNDKVRAIINKIIKNRYLIFVIISSFSFGLLHIENYKTINLEALISVISRIIAGFYLAFIVTKYDFKSSYFLHVINNIMPFIIVLVVK